MMILTRLALGAALLTVAGAAFADAESARRAFFDPEGRAQKYQTAEQIFPTRRVHAGADVLALPRIELPDGFDIRYEFEGKSYGIEDFNRRTNSNALLILKGGRIVHESYRNGALPTTRFISFSTGKSFTSTLVGIALERGLIDSLDDPLEKYLPSLIGSAYEGVTIKNALQMLSGVAWDEEAYDWSDTSKPLVRDWNGAYVEQRYRMVEGANSLPRAHAPGEKFNYSTMESSILGWLVETVSRQRLAEFMEQQLWRPAGMEFDAAWVLDGPESIGREMGGGGLLATLRDFGRFGLMMARGGSANGRQIVSPEWVRAATHPNSDATGYGHLYPEYPLGYGYQWWLLDDDRFEAQGVYGQLIFVAPREDVVIVKLSYWPDAWVTAHELESYAFFGAAIEAVRSLGGE
ncbi:MAG: serine hydrolase [Pseudomonadales bacterium]